MNNTCTGCNKPSTDKVTTQKVKNINECMYKMQDGRSFTDYRPRCTIQYQMKNEDMKNSYDSRMYLINNAESMIKANQEIINKKNNCMDCSATKMEDTFLPEQNMIQCDEHTCNFSQENATGLGTGRHYK